MARLLIFDFDGTLYHTGPGIHLAINNTFKQLKMPELTYETVSACIGQGLEKLIEKLDLKNKMSRHDLHQMIRLFYQEYEKVFLKHSELYDGVLEFLKAWPHEMAIASNKDVRFVQALVEHGPLKEFTWTAIFGGNSFSTKKPDPVMIHNILSQSKYEKNDALMVGDGEPDMLVAQNAGIKSVAVSFGYAPIEHLRQLGAHSEISHFNELAASIQQLWGRS